MDKNQFSLNKDTVSKNLKAVAAIGDPIYINYEIDKRLKFDHDKCINIFEVISSPVLLTLAYLTIKSNPGNMVRGTDNETLDGLEAN